MSDQETQTGRDDDAQDGAGDSGTQADATAAQDGNGDSGTDSQNITPEDARKLRSEARSLRQRLKAAEDKLTARETADLTEQQKLEREKTTLEAERDQLATDNRNLRAEIAAAKVGIRTEALGDAVKLLDWSEIDDPTSQKQVETALKQLVKDKPYLSGRPDGLDGGNGRQQAQQAQGSMNEIIRRAAGRS